MPDETPDALLEDVRQLRDQVVAEGARILDDEEGFPALPEVAICLHHRADEPPATALAAKHLAQALRA